MLAFRSSSFLLSWKIVGDGWLDGCGGTYSHCTILGSSCHIACGSLCQWFGKEICWSEDDTLSLRCTRVLERQTCWWVALTLVPNLRGWRDVDGSLRGLEVWRLAAGKDLLQWFEQENK